LNTRIKICGITSPDMAMHACRAGANAIGLMFYPKSSRYLSPDQAVDIGRCIPPFVSRVGVLANPDRQFVDEILKKLQIDYLQFHGEEPPEFCASFGIPYIKAIRVKESTPLPALERKYHDAAGLLLDSYVADRYGGSGKSFAWEKARYGGNKPIILAGGLTAENVLKAIDAASPYAVDVSSGVETNGVKDPEKISAFCEKVISKT
jgi:phosphoribosylanthranilate isomerase